MPKELKIKNIEKCTEALLKDMSMGDIRKILSDSLKEKIIPTAEYSYIEDLWEDKLVYSTDTGSFQIAFAIDENGGIIWGIPSEVVRKVTYEPKESRSFDFQGILLKEGKEANVFPVKIIQPGWGSSGYYPKEVLQRDAPVFKSGLQMFWDHPSMSQEADRPERTLRDLAGVLATAAEWKEDKVNGSGLYATAKVFEPYVSAVKELAPHIGVSIRAAGTAKEGEADGETGLIIEEITDAASVDFVTMPGAGGKVLELFESFRNKEVKEKGIEMAELKELQEANEQLTKDKEDLTAEKDALQKEVEAAKVKEDALKAESLINLSTAYVEKLLADTDLPEAAQKKLLPSLILMGEYTEAEVLDEAKLAKAVETAVANEKAYIESLLPEGGIKGMGDIDADAVPEKSDKVKEAFKTLYMKQGFSLEEAEKMASLGE